LRGHICRAFDDSNNVQPIEAKEEIHPWEKHTGELCVWVKRNTPDRVLCASSEHLQKRHSSADTVIALCVHQLMVRIIEIIALFAFSRVMSMSNDREIV
jgi:hypothetical protein